VNEPLAADPIDDRGRLCPAPVISLGRLAKVAPPGSLIEVWADDPAAAVDIPAWCRMRSATLVEVRDLEGAGHAYLVRTAIRD